MECSRFKSPPGIKLLTTLPENGTYLSIIPGEKLQVEHIDDPVVVQVRGFGKARVVIHSDRQRIEMVDCKIAINIAGQ